jgi:hypothetical protein
MSDGKLVAWLEKLSQLPADASLRERYLAQRTSWWGKRLDPTQFWRGRVVWWDTSAANVASAHGRLFPPVPYDDPQFHSYSDKDLAPLRAGSEGTDVYAIYSDREKAFWWCFHKTHPMPPEQIELNQRSVAREANEFDWASREQRSGPRRWDQLAARARSQMIEQGCPPEALSDDALRWAYTTKMREDYQHVLALSPPAMTLRTNSLFRHLSVDRRYITDRLTDEEISTAGAWKTAYLQRLRREKTDESYITAYLKAWSLSADAVFGRTNSPSNTAEAREAPTP